MKENLKNKIFLLLVLLTIMLLIASVGFYQDASRQKRLLNQQRAAHMELEEKTLNLSNLNKDLEQRTVQLQEQLNQEKAVYQAAYKTLNQEILELKEKLEGVDK